LVFKIDPHGAFAEPVEDEKIIRKSISPFSKGGQNHASSNLGEETRETEKDEDYFAYFPRE